MFFELDFLDKKLFSYYSNKQTSKNIRETAYIKKKQCQIKISNFPGIKWNFHLLFSRKI